MGGRGLTFLPRIYADIYAQKMLSQFPNSQISGQEVGCNPRPSASFSYEHVSWGVIEVMNIVKEYCLMCVFLVSCDSNISSSVHENRSTGDTEDVRRVNKGFFSNQRKPLACTKF